MTDRLEIESYAHAFEAHLACSVAERSQRRAELVGYLADAAEDGGLPEALERLGTPEEAAQSFARERIMPLAAMRDRLSAACIDNAPLLAVAVVVVAQQVMRALAGADQGFSITAVFPPLVYVRFDAVCVAFGPFGCGVYGGGVLSDVGVPLAVAWSILGVGLLEARSGSTPGKRLRGLRVVTETGLRISVASAVVRRLSFLGGPFAWLDWAPGLWGERRRILDRVTATKVVVADPGLRGRSARADELPRPWEPVGGG